MAYEPTVWRNREVENPRTYTLQNNVDGTVTLNPAEGTIIENGTPIVAENMNKIESQIKDNDTRILDLFGTSEIIEWGENTNGEFVKWANGFQLCYANLWITSPGNSNRIESRWNFPSSFKGGYTPTIFPGGNIAAVSYGDYIIYPYTRLVSNSGVTVRIQVASSANFGAGQVVMSWSALGMWK